MRGFKTFLDENLADMAFYQSHGDARDALESLGINLEKYDRLVDSGNKLADKVFTGSKKIDSYIGIKKSILLAVPTYRAKINFLNAVYNLSRHPKKLQYWTEVLASLTELSKLGLMNPMLAVPSGLAAAHSLGIKDSDALVATISKLLSTSYFYLDTMTEILKTSRNEKIAEVASTVSKILLPHSDIKR
jgi:hypothetical protein